MFHMRYEEANVDVAALIKKSREQRITQQTTTTQKTTSTNNTVKVIQNTSDLESVKGGEYVQTEDGVNAYVIDHEEQVRKLRENDKTGTALLNLVNSTGLISDANAYVPDYGENAPEDYDPGLEWAGDNEHDPKAKKLNELKNYFSEFAVGINGLTDDPLEAMAVQEAMEKIYGGEVVLPTPEEYKKQKEELAKKKAERKERLKNKSKQNQQNNQKPARSNPEPIRNNQQQKEEPESELQMAEMPENAIIRKGAVEEMAELLGNAGNPAGGTSVQTQNHVAIAGSNKPRQTPQSVEKAAPTHVTPVAEKEPEVDQSMQQVETYGESESGLVIDTPPEQSSYQGENQEESNPFGNGVLNLAEAQDAVAEAAEKATATPPQTEQQEPITVINVPQGEVDNVIRQLPLDTYDKVVTSKSIQVNEVELKDVPVATRTVTNIDDYRALKARRTTKKDSEVTERVLINSGIIVTVKAATSMEMATIFKNTMYDETDWSKMYQFCYQHTVMTSVGKPSYNDFVAKVSPRDIETVLDGIYEISETDERNVELNCGEGEGGCGKQYTAKFEVKKLANVNRLPEKSIRRVKEIVDARNDPMKAKEIQKNSPTCLVKCAQLGDRTVHIRPTTGHMMIERIDQINNIANRYNQLIALLILYIEKITITLPPVRDDVPADSFDIVDTESLCEELKSLDDDELEQIKYIVAEKLDDYESVTYSLKGQFVCPHCQMVKTEVPCSISDLVFQRVQRMLE